MVPLGEGASHFGEGVGLLVSSRGTYVAGAPARYLFANREQRLAAALDDIVAIVESELAAEDFERLGWRGRVRTGLWTILSTLDREPVLARVCIVQAMRAGPLVQERRKKILSRLAAVVDQGYAGRARGSECGQLTAEGLVGVAFTIVYGRLVRGEGQLTGLLSELMEMIVLPYLGSAASRHEGTRIAPAPPNSPRRGRERVTPSVRYPLEGATMRLSYRTARVLEGNAIHEPTYITPMRGKAPQ
jgi:AcrR family transcriptional regulator